MLNAQINFDKKAEIAGRLTIELITIFPQQQNVYVKV